MLDGFETAEVETGAWGDDVQGRALDAGHFFPEEKPTQTADALERFFHATS